MVGQKCKGIAYLHLHTINGHRSSRAFPTDVCVGQCLSTSAAVRCVEQLREQAQSRIS